jgi:16S rRNA (guanine1516-N2)-methyltransferase
MDINDLPPCDISVSSTIHSLSYLQKAEALANNLGIKYSSDFQSLRSKFCLCLTDAGLQLLQRDKNNRYRTCLLVDFNSPRLVHRLNHNLSIKQSLARAIGAKRGTRPPTIDATAGLGVDALLIAAYGCRVLMLERNPILHALLEDGLNRARQSTGLIAELVERMALQKLDAVSFFTNPSTDLSEATVYLDPMFPKRATSALAKKDIRSVGQVVGRDTDQRELFEAAWQAAPKRIVVKRYKDAAPLGNLPRADHVLTQKSSRFDIYFPQARSS